MQLSRKDEVRSSVQQLVAREDALKSELQNMESNQKQDEQAKNEQEGPLSNENTQTGEGAQEAPNKIAQNENELTVNEIYDQAPVLLPRQAAAVPDVVSTVQTRAAPLVSSDQTCMRFHVRNFEGHNDLICGVDCRGAVLVSGR